MANSGPVVEPPCICEIENHDLYVSGLFYTFYTWWICDGILKLLVFMSIVESNDASEFILDIDPLRMFDMQSAGHAVKPWVLVLLGHMVCRISNSLFCVQLPSNVNMIGIKICG